VAVAKLPITGRADPERVLAVADTARTATAADQPRSMEATK